MAKVVLVHGLAATDKSWFSIPKLLKAKKHQVEAIRLPDPPSDTLDAYVEKISSAVPATEECILVGHSMGGVSISEVAARLPERVSKLVYVSALVPRDGESAGEVLRKLSINPISMIREFQELGISIDDPALNIESASVPEGQFNARSSFDSIEKHYIRCSNDGIVSPKNQSKMIEKLTFESTPEIPSGHIPQKQEPDKLANILLQIID